MKKIHSKIIRVLVILAGIIVLSLIALNNWNLDEATVTAALFGGALGAFWGLFLREIIDFTE